MLGRERRLGLDDALLHRDGLVVLVGDELLANLGFTHVGFPPEVVGRSARW